MKLFPAVANLFVLILFSRCLSPISYGQYQNFWIRLLLIGTIAGIGIPTLVLTYRPEQWLNFYHQISTRFKLTWLGGLIILSALFAYLEWNEIRIPIYISFGILVIYILYNIIESLLISFQKSHQVAVINFIFSVVFILIHLCVWSQQIELHQLWFFLAVVMFLRLIVLFFLLKSNIKNLTLHDDNLYSFEAARKLWLHLGWNDIIQIVFRWIDKFLISILLTAKLSGIYFNGTQDVPFLPLLLGAISSSVLVQLSSKHSLNNQLGLMMSTSRLTGSVIFPIFFFLLFFSDEIFLQVFGEQFEASIPLFLITILVLPLRAYNYTSVLQHLHQGHVLLKGAIADLIIALILMYPLYQIWGMKGMVLSFVFSTYLQVGYYLYFICKYSSKSIGQILPMRTWINQMIVSFCLFLLIYGLQQKFLLTSVQALILGFLSLIIVVVSDFLLQWKKQKYLSS